MRHVLFNLRHATAVLRRRPAFSAAATFAAWLPARRAASIDPMRSLRAE